MSILKDWRAVASNCPNILTSKLIRDAADELQAALAILHTNPDAERMRAVNAAWAKGARYVSTATQMPDPSPPIAGAGDGSIVLFARAA